MGNHRLKIPIFGLLLLFGLYLGLVYRPVAGQPSDNITITGADSSKPLGLTNSSTLQSALATVADRPAVQFSEQLRNLLLGAPPAPLQTQLNLVGPRIALQFGQAQRLLTLAYPSGRFNDNTPPNINSVGSTVGNAGAYVVLHWGTDEFAKGTVAYGPQPGVHSQSVSETDYALDHQVRLEGLTPETTYYYIITSVDRDGNSGTTNEATFVTSTVQKVYLPQVSR